MATRSGSEVGRLTRERPDIEYALIAGLYGAALLAPAAVLVISSFVADAGALYISFLAAVALIAIGIGWLISQTPGVAVRLGQRIVSWILVLIPFSWFLGAFGAGAVGIHPPDLAVPLAMIGTTTGMLSGALLAAMSRNRYTAARLVGATDHTEWEARWPARLRRIVLAITVGSYVLWGLGLGAGLLFGVDWAVDLYYLVLFTTPLSTGVLNPRTFRATDAGLVIERSLQHRLRSWSAFESYTLTDEALVIRPAAWWRIDLRCDRTDIENIDTTVATLDAVLSTR
jgi:hypothetical protein